MRVAGEGNAECNVNGMRVECERGGAKHERDAYFTYVPTVDALLR